MPSNIPPSPGPWSFGPAVEDQTDGHWSVAAVDGFFVAGVITENDARLIAAAPDLLEALKALVRHDKAADAREELPGCLELQLAEEVIVKAEGE